jgi:hypothetical protein
MATSTGISTLTGADPFVLQPPGAAPVSISLTGSFNVAFSNVIGIDRSEFYGFVPSGMAPARSRPSPSPGTARQVAVPHAKSPPTIEEVGVTATDAITSTCDPLRDNATDPVPNSAFGYGLVNAKAAHEKIHPPVGDFPTPSTDAAAADGSGSQPSTDTSTTPATGDTSTTEPTGSVSSS